MFGKSLRDHLLSRYRNAFAAIVLTQLRIKGWQKGMQARAVVPPDSGIRPDRAAQPVSTLHISFRVAA